MHFCKMNERRSLLVSFRKHGTRIGLLTAALGVSASVVASPPPPHASNVTSVQPASKLRWFQVGKASWYGRHFQGHKTATGERYDMNALTCAHRSLPLGSWIRVTNLGNRRFTFLRVNDRGPVARNLVVDLSYAAAQKLGLSGLGRVKIEQINPNDTQTMLSMMPQMPLFSTTAVVAR